ncbi:hypothetical protein PV326_003081 [Microctonus aethiopoides]|uniref:Large ribosomal subunit protein bL33m n=1 Tax=Microctonus aethiopoides TaxID=144406 RepID=A0AA39KTM0_9HYME|nr:hypothetical protein PV326_003081 [Microctonus aethiopoides]KAK0173320.1 hypothetical protein PV328_006535 [Microctonus aethiopoides]
MLLTVRLLAKKAKSKHILVLVESMVTGHHKNIVRERLGDKLEFIGYDPLVGTDVLFREKKKLRSIRNWKDKNVAVTK